MVSTNCLNCTANLEHGQKFCPACGQKTDTHRLTFAHFLHEGFHAFTHADTGIFHLLKCLATRPGTTAREYLRGKRKAYFNPFTFFLLIMALFVFLNSFFAPVARPIEPDTRVLARIPTQAGREKYIATIHRAAKASNFMRNNGNILAMIAIPYISFLTWLFFKRRGFNYAEHLTANMMFITFSNLLFAILVFPLQAMARHTSAEPFVVWIGLLLQILYLAWSLNGFLTLKTAGARTKSLGVSALAIILWMFLTLTGMAVYIYQSKDFYKFFSRFAG